MQKSIQIDEENMAKEQELMARLATENKVGPIKKTMLTRYVYGVEEYHKFFFKRLTTFFFCPIEIPNSGVAEASKTNPHPPLATPLTLYKLNSHNGFFEIPARYIAQPI